ncbi:MAG TPA: ABC transporter permease [Puia sp.]|jgi:putative ABC transport system permease protein|nr:ABC transporter permease [Puia sp.]
MFRNYLKTALRNLSRRRSFSVINIAGLTLGLTATLLIALFVWGEHQYDRSIPGGDRIYRVYLTTTNDHGTADLAVTPPVFAGTLQREYPAIQEVTRVLSTSEDKQLFEAGDKQLYEVGGLFVDSTFLKVFRLTMDYGSNANALDKPASVVLSREMATRYFGADNPIGHKILIGKKPVEVTGVFEKDPKFHLSFDYLRPLSSLDLPADRMQSWGWQQFYTYVVVHPGTNIQPLEANFRQLIRQRAWPDTKPHGFTYLPHFQALWAIHLYSSDLKFDHGERGNITYVNALIVIAVFILLIACFNFINLSTALAIRRAREVGVRKAVGAARRQLIGQFIGETLLLTLFSVILAGALTALLLPVLNHFAGTTIPAGMLLHPMAVAGVAVLVLVVGLLAGFYPALVLSGFDPVKVLKSGAVQPGSPGRTPWLRHSLVVVQFSLSILLILSAIIVFRQVDYLHHKDLGFNKDEILFFPLRGDNLAKNTDAFRTELLHLPGVSSVSIGYGYPGDAVAGDQIIVNRNGQQVTQSVTQLTIDYDYIKTLQLQLVAGRDFSRAMGTDQDHAWIINETAVRELGFGTPEKALGQTLSWHPWDGNNPDSLKVGTVIGVVKDFNYKSLYDKVEPAVLQIYPQAAWKVAVKLSTANLTSTLSRIGAVWNKYSPDYPLEYKFLDDNFRQLYESEDKLQTLLWAFTGIAIFIGCLGLFGLAAYTAETRRKEIGIRKILGANTRGVLALLSRDFIRPVLLSLLIASPVTVFVMGRWLDGFAYRVAIAWWMFVLAGAMAVVIAMVTVGYQTVRAARVSPVKSLRSE